MVYAALAVPQTHLVHDGQVARFLVAGLAREREVSEVAGSVVRARDQMFDRCDRRRQRAIAIEADRAVATGDALEAVRAARAHRDGSQLGDGLGRLKFVPRFERGRRQLPAFALGRRDDGGDAAIPRAAEFLARTRRNARAAGSEEGDELRQCCFVRDDACVRHRARMTPRGYAVVTAARSRARGATADTPV